MTTPLRTRRRWEIRSADCLVLMPRLDAASIDAVITDPPYGINISDMSWDSPRRLDPMRPSTQIRSRTAPRLAFQGFCAAWASQCFRVLKPGAHLAAFSATRTVHLLACGLEDAGFELRDLLIWLHGNGYPGARPIEGGLATGLKPAVEPILLARKPLEGTLESNLSTHGTGALNIDAGRIVSGDESCSDTGRNHRRQGRWPANLLLSHSPRCTRNRCERDCPVELLGTRHRFFYCAKPTRRERDAGCERLPRHAKQTYKIGAQWEAHARGQPRSEHSPNGEATRPDALARTTTHPAAPRCGTRSDRARPFRRQREHWRRRRAGGRSVPRDRARSRLCSDRESPDQTLGQTEREAPLVSHEHTNKRDQGARRPTQNGGGRPARRGSRPAPVRDTMPASKQSGRAALERPRPDTGGNDSHAGSTYRDNVRDIDAFANWFADWWLRRGRYRGPTGGDRG